MDRISLFKKLLDEKRNTTMVHEHYLNTLREYAPGTNLYMREMHFLMAADPEQAVSITDLSKKLEVTLGAASQMAAKLEKKGFIMRYPDPEDRRRSMVRLTENGIKLYWEHLEYDRKSLETLSNLFRDFSDEEIKRFIEAEGLFRKGFSLKVNHHAPGIGPADALERPASERLK